MIRSLEPTRQQSMAFAMHLHPSRITFMCDFSTLYRLLSGRSTLWQIYKFPVHNQSDQRSIPFGLTTTRMFHNHYKNVFPSLKWRSTTGGVNSTWHANWLTMYWSEITQSNCPFTCQQLFSFVSYVVHWNVSNHQALNKTTTGEIFPAIALMKWEKLMKTKYFCNQGIDDVGSNFLSAE